MCIQCCYSSTSTIKQKDGAMLYLHTYGSRDRNTWEKSVSCQHGDIKPSYIKTVHEAFNGADTVFRPHDKVNSKHDSYIYPLR